MKNNQIESARKLLQRSLKSLPNRKRKYFCIEVPFLTGIILPKSPCGVQLMITNTGKSENSTKCKGNEEIGGILRGRSVLHQTVLKSFFLAKEKAYAYEICTSNYMVCGAITD